MKNNFTKGLVKSVRDGVFDDYEGTLNIWTVWLNGPYGPEKVEYRGASSEQEVRRRVLDDRPLCSIIKIEPPNKAKL